MGPLATPVIWLKRSYTLCHRLNLAKLPILALHGPAFGREWQEPAVPGEGPPSLCAVERQLAPLGGGRFAFQNRGPGRPRSVRRTLIVDGPCYDPRFAGRKFSTPVEKVVENRHKLCRRSSNGAIYRPFSRGERARGPSGRRFGDHVSRNARGDGISRGRKSGIRALMGVSTRSVAARQSAPQAGAFDGSARFKPCLAASGTRSSVASSRKSVLTASTPGSNPRRCWPMTAAECRCGCRTCSLPSGSRSITRSSWPRPYGMSVAPTPNWSSSPKKRRPSRRRRCRLFLTPCGTSRLRPRSSSPRSV